MNEDCAVLLFVGLFAWVAWHYCKEIIIEHFKSIGRRND